MLQIRAARRETPPPVWFALSLAFGFALLVLKAGWTTLVVLGNSFVGCLCCLFLSSACGHAWALTCHCSQTGLQFNLRCTSNCSHGAKPLLLTREATYENVSLLLRGTEVEYHLLLVHVVEERRVAPLIRCGNSGVGIVRFAVHQRGAGHFRHLPPQSHCVPPHSS